MDHRSQPEQPSAASETSLQFPAARPPPAGREADASGDSGADHTVCQAENPRAFAMGVGAFLLMVGGSLVLTSCCLWSMSGWLLGSAAQGDAPWSENLRGAWLPDGLLALAIVLTLIGGLGMMGAGAGLQGEKRYSGYWAMGATGMMAAGWWAAGIGAIIADRTSMAVVAVILALVSTVLLVLAVLAAGVMRAFPPPAEVRTISEAELQAMLAEKRARRWRDADSGDPRG